MEKIMYEIVQFKTNFKIYTLLILKVLKCLKGFKMIPQKAGLSRLISIPPIENFET